MTHMTTSWRPSVTDELVAGNKDLWEAMADHPWVRALAAGSLPEDALVAWAGQCRLFCLMERSALLHLRSLADPGELDDLLARLVDDTGREPRQLAQLLCEHGAAIPAQAWPVCLGYGSYVQAVARRGRLEGLAAIHAVERAYLDTWTSVLPQTPPGSPWRQWVENWSCDEFRAVVAGLGTWLDMLAGPATGQLLDHLKPIYRNVALWEHAFWTMSWTGQGWPGLEVPS
jgi:thiaminase (transcriptional activator TenA)